MHELNRPYPNHRRLGLLLLAVLVPVVCVAAQNPRHVQAVTVAAERLEKHSVLQGQVLPLQSMRLVPRVTGYVLAIHVSEGDQVRSGTKLVSVDCPDLRLQKQVADAMVQQARAMQEIANKNIEASRQSVNVAIADQVAAASATQVAAAVVTVAEASYERVGSLREAKAATQEEWEQAQMAHARSKAELAAANSDRDAAKARVAQAQALVALREAELEKAKAGVAVALAKAAQTTVQLGFATLRSPYATARVTRQIVDAGTLAIADQTAILEVMDVSKVRIRLGVPHAEATYVKTGTPARIVIPGEDRADVEAKITRTSGALGSGSRTMAAEIVLPNADAAWLPGALVSVELLLQRADAALIVPARALVKRGADTSVWTVANGRARKTRVRVGIDLGRRVQILSGIEGGAEVIVAGLIGLRDGDPVEVELVKR